MRFFNDGQHIPGAPAQMLQFLAHYPRDLLTCWLSVICPETHSVYMRRHARNTTALCAQEHARTQNTRHTWRYNSDSVSAAAVGYMEWRMMESPALCRQRARRSSLVTKDLRPLPHLCSALSPQTYRTHRRVRACTAQNMHIYPTPSAPHCQRYLRL